MRIYATTYGDTCWQRMEKGIHSIHRIHNLIYYTNDPRAATIYLDFYRNE